MAFWVKGLQGDRLDIAGEMCFLLVLGAQCLLIT